MSAEIVRPTSPESAAGGTVECDAGGKSTSYELFIGAISILSLVNLLLFLLPMDDDEHRVIVALDLFLALVLLTDFTYRLITAPNRTR